jgi:hypothetical protein
MSAGVESARRCYEGALAQGRAGQQGSDARTISAINAVIRAVDSLVGATNAMRIEASGRKGSRVRLSVTHEDLEQCVGLATAAFAVQAVSSADIPAGVYFPAELPRVARQSILDGVKRDAFVWEFESIGPVER